MAYSSDIKVGRFDLNPNNKIVFLISQRHHA